MLIQRHLTETIKQSGNGTSNYYARVMYMRRNCFNRGVLNVKSETFMYPHCNEIRLPGQLAKVISITILLFPRLGLAPPEQLRRLVCDLSHFGLILST